MLGLYQFMQTIIFRPYSCLSVFGLKFHKWRKIFKNGCSLCGHFFPLNFGFQDLNIGSLNFQNTPSIQVLALTPPQQAVQTQLMIFILTGPLIHNPSCVDLWRDSSETLNVTVNWTQCGGESVDFYLINITTNASHTPYGGLLNITNSSVTQHKLTGFQTGCEYSVTVRGACGGQEGNESEPLLIIPQGMWTDTLNHSKA